VAGTLVFIPAWNEESSLPGVLAEAHGALPDDPDDRAAVTAS